MHSFSQPACSWKREDVISDVKRMMKGATKSNLWTVVQTIFEFLISIKVMHRMRINSDIIGCHPLNRNGLGIVPIEVHRLFKDFLHIGFDPNLVKAVATDGEHFPNAGQWNVEMAKSSHNMLAPCEVEHLKYFTLWGGHTNQVLRLAVHKVFVELLPEVCNNNKLSLEKLRDIDAALHKAATEGLEWLVIPSWLLKEVPGLANLIQAAGNVTESLAREENDLQGFCKLEQLASDAKSTPTYSEIKDTVQLSMPKNIGSFPFMYQFLLHHGGGLSFHLMKETRAAVMAEAVPSKTLNADTYDFLGQLFKGSVQSSLFRHGCLQSLWLEDTLNQGDVRRMHSKDILLSSLFIFSKAFSIWGLPSSSKALRSPKASPGSGSESASCGRAHQGGQGAHHGKQECRDSGRGEVPEADENLERLQDGCGGSDLRKETLCLAVSTSRENRASCLEGHARV